MIGIENNLYPPEIATWAPAFIHTEPCRIYFSLSVYNTAKEIKNVQVTVNNQNTNASMLNGTKYPTGIMITSLKIDATKTDDEKYYIEIVPKSDIAGGKFEINQFYKVQIRFTGMKAIDPPGDGKIAGWLIDNQQYFSEWSRVCLIKGISRPVVELRDFSDMTEEQIIQFSSLSIQFVGRLTFVDESGAIENRETEKLKSYRFYFVDASTEDIVFDSGDILVNRYDHPNEINYLLPYLFEENKIYIMHFSFTTDNEYTESTFHRQFMVIEHNIGDFDAMIIATPNKELGCLDVAITSERNEIFVNNVIIRRTSNESDFKLWEDIHTELIVNELNDNLNFIWHDFTVKSGVLYQYAAQTIDTNQHRSIAIKTNYPEMVELDDMFLTHKEMQIRLRYDPTISSYRRAIAESVTETIGSKYPFFRRNGNMNYRQFPISGLITCFCDEEGIFLNKDNIYGDHRIYYDEYNEKENIDQWQDYIYEREFREKVMDFLYGNTVKLFRSNTEGNILVKLMDINFTPNQTLGRMLYSFNATAYEVDECSISNYNKYGIIPDITIQEKIEHTYDQVGQLSLTKFSAGVDLFNIIADKTAEMVESEFSNELQYLRAVKFYFTSEPYLIETAEDGTPKPFSGTTVIDVSAPKHDDLVYGWIIKINNENIVVPNPHGFYELSDEGTYITSIIFPVDTEAEIDYVGTVITKENAKLLVSKYLYNILAGQLYGSFTAEESLSSDIYLKYRIEAKDYYQKLLSIDRLIVEAPAGTVIYLKDMYDDKYYRHEIGSTGTLRFYDSEAVIMDAYVRGVHLSLSPEGRDVVRDSEYLPIEGEFNTFEEIEEPVKNGVYTVLNADLALTESQKSLLSRPINNITNSYLLKVRDILENPKKQYIYYNEEWFIFSDDHDVICPVDLLVDYVAETVKGEYQV